MNAGRGIRRVGWLIAVLAMCAPLFTPVLSVVAAPAPLFAWQTGHVIPAAFRPLWEQVGSEKGLGWPIDEATVTGGTTEQWYEYGRVFQRANGVPELAAVGRERATFRSMLTMTPFKNLPAPIGAKPANAEFVSKWGHWTANGFYSVWNTKKSLLGAPISEEFTEDGGTVQYFENGRLELDPTANNVARITALGLLAHGPAAPAIDPPANVDFIGEQPIHSIQGVKAHKGRWILVNLTEQHLYAYEDDKLVNDSLVSTGTAANPTPPGTYTIQQRFRLQRMVGDGYDLPDVPHVQYFGNENLSWHEGYSFHGAYWHNNWGHVMSHGCVGEPLDFAAWLWDWASVGTVAEIIAG